ncbi:MAG TPA: hypothetical protein VGJ04_11925, partial [Pirellulales bacterium]
MFNFKLRTCCAGCLVLLTIEANRLVHAADNAKLAAAPAATTDDGKGTSAAESATAPAVRHALSASEDRRRMLELLHLPTSEGPFPPMADDPKRPVNSRPAGKGSNYTDDEGDTIVRSSYGSWSNYDDAKANPYPLPEVLVLKNGQPVTDAETWGKKRRPEIMEDFDREIYGRVPAETPKVKWEVTSTEDDGKVKIKHLVGHVDNSADPE